MLPWNPQGKRAKMFQCNSGTSACDVSTPGLQYDVTCTLRRGLSLLNKNVAWMLLVENNPNSTIEYPVDGTRRL